MPDSNHDEKFLETQSRHFRQCVKEARFVIVTWLITLFYVGTTIGLMGYVPVENRPDDPSLILGIPAWVCWGLLLPWFVLIGVTWWFAIFMMKEDEPYMDFPNREPESLSQTQP